MKKSAILVFAFVLAASLSFAQNTGGKNDNPQESNKPAASGKTTHKSGKKGHKGGKKSKKGSAADSSGASNPK